MYLRRAIVSNNSPVIKKKDNSTHTLHTRVRDRKCREQTKLLKLSSRYWCPTVELKWIRIAVDSDGIDRSITNRQFERSRDSVQYLEARSSELVKLLDLSNDSKVASYNAKKTSFELYDGKCNIEPLLVRIPEKVMMIGPNDIQARLSLHLSVWLELGLFILILQSFIWYIALLEIVIFSLWQIKIISVSRASMYN